MRREGERSDEGCCGRGGKFEPTARNVPSKIHLCIFSYDFAVDRSYLYLETRGTRATVPTASSALSGIAAGPDGALWFTENNGNKIGRITTGGKITEYPVLTGSSGPTGIAAGPDGALWFTEFSVSKIGRITTGGTITAYPIPTANSGPVGIAVGPDGALWFTEENQDKIGRVGLQ